MNQLIPIESVNAIELFSDQKSIEALLSEIEKQAKDFDPDTTTATGRKEIASQAHKVSRSKVVIDAAGKELTEEWAKKKKVVDECRKLARDFCDNLRDEIRQPLTEYEAEEERKSIAAAEAAKYEADYLEAVARDELVNREIAVRLAEEKLAAEQAERDRIETEKREAEELAARNEQIRKDAEEKANREAAEAIEREKKAREESEQRAIEQAEKAERDRIAAEELAKREKQEAIEREQKRAKEEADEKERKRLRLIEDNEREAQRRAADTENRRTINNSIVAALVAGGISEPTAKKVVTIIASGKVPSISIRY